MTALALASGVRDGLVSPILDARRGEIYAALAELNGGVVRMLHQEVAVPLARWLDVIGDRPCTFVGDAVYLLDATERPGWTLLPYEEHHASGAVIAQLGEERLRCGQGDPIGALEPLYCRPSAAELKRV